MSVNKHDQVLTVVLFPPFWRFILSQQHNRENIVCLSVCLGSLYVPHSR
jgi:hypothetical protein